MPSPEATPLPSRTRAGRCLGLAFRGHYSFKEPVEMNRGETGRLTLSFSDADTFTFRGRAKIQTVISGLDMAPRHW